MAFMEWCKVCGGAGFVDEEAAARIRLPLGDARTAICPRCNGTGGRAHHGPRRAQLVALAITWTVRALLLGALALAAILSLFPSIMDHQ